MTQFRSGSIPVCVCVNFGVGKFRSGPILERANSDAHHSRRMSIPDINSGVTQIRRWADYAVVSSGAGQLKTGRFRNRPILERVNSGVCQFWSGSIPV